MLGDAPLLPRNGELLEVMLAFGIVDGAGNHCLLALSIVGDAGHHYLLASSMVCDCQMHYWPPELWVTVVCDTGFPLVSGAGSH